MKINLANSIAALFIFLFVYTALSKFFNLAQFQFTLAHAPFIGKYSQVMMILIPTIEILIAVLLVIPRTRRVGLVDAFGLMTLFTLYIAYALAAHLKLPCSCGGIIQQLSWKGHLLLNVCLTLIAGVAGFGFLKNSSTNINFFLRNSRGCRKPVERVGHN
jgi:hypothetical protein